VIEIDADWIDEYGYVQLAVRGAPAAYTVKRLDQYGTTLIPIPGYEDSTWISGGAGYAEDYRPPLGVTVTWVVAPVGATADAPAYVRATLTTPGGYGWLRDVSNPVLARRLTVADTGDESLPAYQHVYDISGRRLPLVVHDVREGRRGSVVLVVPDRDERRALEGLLATGNPLLLSMCSDLVWQSCMMAVGDAVFSRIEGRAAQWLLRLDYIEVDDPLRMAGQRIVSVTWADVIAGYPKQPGDPVPVTWQWVPLSFADWLALVLGNRKQ
jgi:hypothetical protein